MSEGWSQEAIDQFLQCPITKEGLAWADAELLRDLNKKIEAGEVANRIGLAMSEPLDAALVNRSGTILYPCYGGLPALLVDEAIDLEKS